MKINDEKVSKTDLFAFHSLSSQTHAYGQLLSAARYRGRCADTAIIPVTAIHKLQDNNALKLFKLSSDF